VFAVVVFAVVVFAVVVFAAAGEPAVADGVAPTRMADAARNRAQSESPTEKVSQRFRPNKDLTSLSLSREVAGVA